MKTLESPAIIALRPKAPIEKEFLGIPIIGYSKALVAHLTDVGHWRSTIQHPQKLLLPLLLDALTISVVQTVFLAVILRVVFDMVRLGDLNLIRMPTLLQGLNSNLNLTAFHLKIGWVYQGGIYWIH